MESRERAARISAVIAGAQDLGLPVMVEPIVVGGARSGQPEDILRLAGEAVELGPRGIVIGRNVWQRSPDMTRHLMQQLHAIVHPGTTRPL